MKLHELKKSEGSTHRRIRVGRGRASGKGKTCGRGEKGQMSRSGSSHKPTFEGGQMPLVRRLPKRGFKNTRFAAVVRPVNLVSLDLFEDGAVVDLAAMYDAGLVNGSFDKVKVLGKGEISKKLTVKAHAFSASAKAAIEAAGGTCEVIA